MTPPTPDFVAQTEPFRPALVALCYRMVGSLEEAQDLVQDTYLRAWRSYAGFEGRSSVRTWLSRIATNLCLTFLQTRSQRRLPSSASPNLDAPEGPWLQPVPDDLIRSPGLGVHDQAALRESVRLALVAALQHLPARQRAALLLTDVLDWSLREVAEALGITTAAVKSLLQRARTRLRALGPDPTPGTSSESPEDHPLLRGYITAFETSDPQALESVLRQDVVLELPPAAQWYAARDALVCATGALGSRGDWKMFPTAANGQPAAAVYHLEGRQYRAFSLVVLTVTPTGIGRITVFANPALFPAFGFAMTLENP